MINLLPPEGHKAVKQEYLFRVGATILLLLSSVAVCLTVAFVPTYVLVGAQIKTFQHETEKENEDVQKIKEAEIEVAQTEKILTQLRSASSSVQASHLIEEVQKYTTAAIHLKTLRVLTDPTKPMQVQVQGIASTRESLARFKIALESSTMFAKAEVPISDLAREVELPFVVTITLE